MNAFVYVHPWWPWRFSHHGDAALLGIHVAKFDNVIFHYNFQCCDENLCIVMAELPFLFPQEWEDYGECMISIDVGVH